MQNLLNRLFGNQIPDPQPQLTPAQKELNTLLETAATALAQGFHETALETYMRGLTLARTIGDSTHIEHFLSGIGAAYVSLARYDDAQPYLDEALALAREMNNPGALARCLNNIGSRHAKQEQWAAAQTYHQQALDAARQSDQLEIIGLTLENLAQDFLHQDNPSYAQHLLKEAVVMTQAAGHLHMTTRVVGLLGHATAKLGDQATAAKLLEQAVTLARQTNQTEPQLEWLQALAEIERAQNRNHDAIRHLQEAEHLALRMGNQSAEFFMNSALELTHTYQRTGNSAQAEEYATRALAQARSTGNAAHEALALTRLGMAAYAMNDLPRAYSFLSEAQKLYDTQAVENPDEHMQILLALGNIAVRQNRLDEAQTTIEQLLTLTHAQDDTVREAEALHLLGNLATRRNDRTAALKHWQTAVTLLGHNGPHHAQLARLRCDIAQTRKLEGDYKAALDEYEKALVLLNHIEHTPTRGLVLANAATLYTETGDIDTAQAFYEEAIEIAQAVNDRHATSVRLGNLGWFLTLTGRPQAAIDQLERALAISRDLDETLLIAVQVNNLARTRSQLHDYEAARVLHKQAVAAATAIDAQRWLAVFRSDMGVTLAALDRIEEAEELYRAALEHSASIDDFETVIHTQARLARLLAQTGQYDEAEQRADDALRQAQRMYYKRGTAHAYHALGDLARARGDDDTAGMQYTQAHHLYNMLHAPEARTLAALLPSGAV